MVKIDQERLPPPDETRRIGVFPTEEGNVTEPLPPDRAEARTRLTEAILDNLPLWTIVALAIGFLYLVWATLDVLGRYIGDLPSVGA